MKIQITSDLHCDAGGPLLPGSADVIVVAGDIGAGCSAHPQVEAWLAAGSQVVLVLGNNDFEGSSIEETVARWQALAQSHPGLHLLDSDDVEIGNVRFLGATLWTDFAYGGNAARAMQVLADAMPEYQTTRFRGFMLRPADTLALHHADRMWLQLMLSMPHEGPTVVVTHHLPHANSVAPEFSASPLNPAFVSDLSFLIERGQPALWVHGHTHRPVDYRMGSTRIVCNPRGYGSGDTGFDPSLVIEL